MAECTQEEADKIVERTQRLVNLLGGDNPTLERVKQWYDIWYRLPEHFAMTVLEAELLKVEKQVGFVENE